MLCPIYAVGSWLTSYVSHYNYCLSNAFNALLLSAHDCRFKPNHFRRSLLLSLFPPFPTPLQNILSCEVHVYKFKDINMHFNIAKSKHCWCSGSHRMPRSDDSSTPSLGREVFCQLACKVYQCFIKVTDGLEMPHPDTLQRLFVTYT